MTYILLPLFFAAVMIAFFASAFLRRCAVFAATGLTLFLSACASGPTQTATSDAPTTQSQTPRQTAARPDPGLPTTPANLVGQHVVKVALLAPFSSNSQAVQQEAQAIQAAAELALFEHGDGQLVLLPKDSGTNAQDAGRAAQEAIAQGADVIIGPMFSSGVEPVAQAARTRNIPIFSLSTDVSQAGNGVYAFTFVPEQEAQRLVSYAISRNVRRFIILAPEGEYGDRVLATANGVIGAINGATVQAIRYGAEANSANTPQLAARQAASLAAGARNYDTAIILVERGARLRTLAQSLANAGAGPNRVRYLGLGTFNSPSTLADPRMLGAWFVTPDLEARAAFDARFAGVYPLNPTRLAGIGYDATALVAALARNGSASGLSAANIGRTSGFVGVDGPFRFQHGVIDRALAVYEIGPNGARQISGPNAGWQ